MTAFSQMQQGFKARSVPKSLPLRLDTRMGLLAYGLTLTNDKLSMSKVMIIGAGGVGRVVAYKCAQHPEVFSEILMASRTKAKCDAIIADVKRDTGHPNLSTAGVDAENVPELVKLIRSFQPKMVIHVALPYQDLTIMDACLEAGVHYLDTANYEPKDEAKFEYSWQWAYQDRFKQAGLTAVLGCGFDPGVTGVFTAYAAKHYFDELHYLDIVDANAGSHGKAFATNFNPEINIREVTQKGKYWENSQWVYTEPHEIWKDVNYPEVGPKRSYLIYHEELESLVKNYPTLKRARFWMTFGDEYLTHLRVIQNIGMAGIAPVKYKGIDIIPLEFLKAVLPDPGELGENYTGTTSIGCHIRGLKDGKTRDYFIWNNCLHQDAYRETGTQGVSFTTGVPAMLGAMMMLQGYWGGAGVFNVEEMNPDPFLAKLGEVGLPWHERVDGEPEFSY
jgi:saccharopine dehydrogenase (NAD+, L-lysine forming)